MEGQGELFNKEQIKLPPSEEFEEKYGMTESWARQNLASLKDEYIENDQRLMLLKDQKRRPEIGGQTDLSELDAEIDRLEKRNTRVIHPVLNSFREIEKNNAAIEEYHSYLDQKEKT